MNVDLEQKEEALLSCEKCGASISAKDARRALLLDGQIHVFCPGCTRHILIVRDGSVAF
jgi:Zn finger protein HypA/HybF involved in hydrogenase expression